MEIYTPAMLRYWMSDVILRFHEGSIVPLCHGGIKLLERGEESLHAECMYVGMPDAVAEAVRGGRLPDEGICILCAGSCPALEEGPVPEQLWLLECGLSLVSLYNRAHEHVHRFRLWDERLQEALYTNAGLQEMLQLASTAFHATLLLVNAGFKHIASVYSPDVSDPTADELRTYGYQSFDTIQTIRRQTVLRGGRAQNFSEYVSDGSGNYTIVRLVQYQDTLAARLIIILNGSEPNPCYSDLGGVLAHYIAEFMFSNQSVDYSSNAAFGSLAADLIEFRLTDPEELEQRLKQIQLAVHRYYHVMLVSFGQEQDRNSIPWNYVISQLERIFPFSNITTYRGEILLIIRKMKRGSRLVYDREMLEQILSHYNGYAAIGNFSEFLTSLPPMYHQAKGAMRLGRTMDPDQRIYYYEDYSMYQIVEMADQSARQDLGSRNIVHLCHPALIALVMYDKKAGGNLTEVLYAYLRNERNAAETAKQLYIHRNTMLYKVRKIEEVIGQSLDDPTLRERLMFSYDVLEYMRRYRKEDILVLKRNYSKDFAEQAQVNTD